MMRRNNCDGPWKLAEEKKVVKAQTVEQDEASVAVAIARSKQGYAYCCRALADDSIGKLKDQSDSEPHQLPLRRHASSGVLRLKPTLMMVPTPGTAEPRRLGGLLPVITERRNCEKNVKD